MSQLDSVPSQRSGLNVRRFRQIHLIAARLQVGAVLAQIALGVIALPIHEWTGVMVALVSLVVATAAIRGRFTSSTVGLSLAALVLVALQGILIALADTIPVLGIIHLIDGFVIFGLAIVVAIESEDEGRETDPEQCAGTNPAPTEQSPGGEFPSPAPRERGQG
jgi:hypothetical protein